MGQIEPLFLISQFESKTSFLGSHSTLHISIFLPPTILYMFTYFSVYPTGLWVLGCLFWVSFAFSQYLMSIWKTEVIYSGTGYLLLILCLKLYYFVLCVHSRYWEPTTDLALNKTHSLKVRSLYSVGADKYIFKTQCVEFFKKKTHGRRINKVG